MADDLAHIAGAVVGDAGVLIADQVLAFNVLHRCRVGLAVSAADELRLRIVFGQRRRQVLELARMYG